MITTTLPEDQENRIRAIVRGGRFVSVDAALAEAARLLLHAVDQEPTAPPIEPTATSPDPILGLMRDHVELMDEIVADAYRRRRETNWRELDL